MKRNKRPTKKPIKSSSSKTQQKSDFEKAGDLAYKNGDKVRALNAYANALRTTPNRDCKIKLTCVLNGASLQVFNENLKKLILLCIKEPNLQYQDLSQAWYSLLMCDPIFLSLQQLILGKEYCKEKLQQCLKDEFFLQGVSKVIVYDMAFESALIKIRTEITNVTFIKAFDEYCLQTEYVFCNDFPKLELYPIDQKIQSLGISDNSVSRSVRQHYEENPYPRWRYIHRQRPLQRNLTKKHQHLIAGCGTGYGACNTALAYPNIKITAIDLSLASLSYAKKKVRQLNIKNIKFYQADILDLSGLEQKFEVIECSGVLHHMDDPVVGWSELLNKLKYNGRLHIGLYSELGRQDILAARKIISEQSFRADHQGIQSARDYIYQLPKEHAAREVMNRHDFYSLSSCRDLLFHEHEQCFTLLQLKAILEQLNLVFIGFDNLPIDVVQQYKKLFPNDPKLNNLDNWHQFELDNPNIFKSMYQFWCCRKT